MLLFFDFEVEGKLSHRLFEDIQVRFQLPLQQLGNGKVWAGLFPHPLQLILCDVDRGIQDFHSCERAVLGVLHLPNRFLDFLILFFLGHIIKLISVIQH